MSHRPYYYEFIFVPVDGIYTCISVEQGNFNFQNWLLCDVCGSLGIVIDDNLQFGRFSLPDYYITFKQFGEKIILQINTYDE